MTGDKYKSLIESSAIQGSNGDYVESMYEEYLGNPESVSPTWQAFFRGVLASGNRDTEQAQGPVRSRFEALGRQRRPGTPVFRASNGESFDKQSGVLRLINYYRVRGHQVARLDPLGLSPPTEVPDLDPAFHGLGPEDMDRQFYCGTLATAERMTLREIIRVLDRVYAGSIGAQYMYINETEQKRWIQQRLEQDPFKSSPSAKRKKEVLKQLVAAEGIERYLHSKYVGQKRFSLEGADSLIPLLDEVMRSACDHGVDELVIGMAHRGRLNVLVNVLGKAPSELFAEFEGKYKAESLTRAGDVKYHLGFSTDVEIAGKRLHLVLAFNPSHLEIVNPVAEGSVRARQNRRRDLTGDRVIPILIHGDAAFAGQGVVLETLQLADSKGYGNGGTVHIIVNNQIGFTTPDPIEVRPGKNSRSSRYCTDIAKMLEAPVFHVNGDDPEAVVFVARLAMDFRETFHKDVIVDLCCYRRHGHNEADEPSVTQPLMYETIKHQPTAMRIYAEKLTDEGVIESGELDTLVQAYRDGLDRGENIVRTTLGMVGNSFTVNWVKYQTGSWDDPVETAVKLSTIRGLAGRLQQFPENFSLHPRVVKIMGDRRRMAAGELPMDWGFAETMAYATLINEGFSVRLSGQDTRRGTFFHRHASVYDIKTNSTYTPLKHLDVDKERFVVNDTLLSEEGVLGYEYGYSSTDPDALVIWEAQFGDFANGAQVVIDQFIASGMVKWGRYCGLTLFLPHGYEGQGPEHSSARLERYLQLCAGNNMQVCVPSTPAQMFHMIRRQMKRNLRLPLIVMTPKSLLRHKASVSTLRDLTHGRFDLVVDEPKPLDRAKVERIVFCSGKIFYDLYEAREHQRLDTVALVRLEQLYPFPREDYQAVIAAYPKARQVVWCQEEPENQGAWYQVKHRLRAYLADDHELIYATRKGTSTTAVGYFQMHQQEQEEVVGEALTGGKPAGGGA